MTGSVLIHTAMHVKLLYLCRQVIDEKVLSIYPQRKSRKYHVIYLPFLSQSCDMSSSALPKIPLAEFPTGPAIREKNTARIFNIGPKFFQAGFLT